MTNDAPSYRGYRFPTEITSHAVWLYHGFYVSFRDVEDMLAYRGITVSYEAIRLWCIKFGPEYARRLKRRQGRLGDAWHLDEVFVTIRDQRQYLWRAVDQDGDVIDILFQSRRDRKAAKRFFRKLWKGQGRVPRRLITDKLRSYPAAHREIMPSVVHCTDRYQNNRVEVSHEPTRQRERQMRRFKSPGQAQRFLTVHGLVLNLFRVGRHLLRARHQRELRARAFDVWETVSVSSVTTAATTALLPARPLTLNLTVPHGLLGWCGESSLKGAAMPSLQALKLFLVCAVVVLVGCASESIAPEAMAEAPEMPTGNLITGEGLPNPAPNVTQNWGTLPDGREWGSTAGIDIDPNDGHIWAYERCGAGNFGAGAPINCDNNPVDPIFKFDRNTGEVLANFGGGLMVTPHGIHVDPEGNVWVTDFAGNEEETKGHQVHKFSPEGELLMSLGTAGKAGSGPNELNQPNDVITAPDGSIFVSDGHSGQNMTSNQAMQEGLDAGRSARILKYSPDGTFVKEWGQIGVEHGEFRTPHALAFDAEGRLWVADRGNHRLEIFDQDGNYLESRYAYGRISGLFIKDGMVYAIDSESSPTNHPNWRNGVRIGPVDGDYITAFIPPFERESRVYQGTAGEGVAVDADGNVYAAEGPNSLTQAGGAFTKYSVN